MSENKITTIEGGQIDQEALDAMSSELVDMSIADEKQMHRTELNFYCELYMLVKKLNQHLDDFTNVISIAGQEKLYEFFKKTSENTQKEIVRQNVQRKIRRGHKTSRKMTKQ